MPCHQKETRERIAGGSLCTSPCDGRNFRPKEMQGERERKRNEEKAGEEEERAKRREMRREGERLG